MIEIIYTAPQYLGAVLSLLDAKGEDAHVTCMGNYYKVISEHISAEMFLDNSSSETWSFTPEVFDKRRLVLEEALRLIKDGYSIAAVKHIKKELELGLQEAKEIYDTLF